MDLNNIGDAIDRISELPDSLIHHILSFIDDDIKCVFRTSILSKRWKLIWTSIPSLVFPSWIGLSKVNNFMDFVDRTLHLHVSSNIQKFSLGTNKGMSASRVHSWISSLAERNVEELILVLDLNKPFFIPWSLFTCESLSELELSVSYKCTVHLPKSFSFPKLKKLTLRGIQFTDDDCWTEQRLSNCPVLEVLNLEYCTWFGVRNFCISTPALKHLDIDTGGVLYEDGLSNCALKIDAPNLVSLTYCGNVPKEYILSSFQSLESARVLLYGRDIPISEQKRGYYGAAGSKFFRALSHVKSLTIESLEVLSIADDFINILPTFHNLDKLFIYPEEATDKSLFLLLKAAPNLTGLEFRDHIHDNDEEEYSWAGLMLTAGCLFQHLQSVCFLYFSGEAREMRWLKLILMNAKALQTVTIGSHFNLINADIKETLISEFPSLPKASDGCLLEFP